MTIEEVHKFFQRAEEVTARGLPLCITKQLLYIFGATLTKQGEWMLTDTGVSGYKSKDILPILTSYEYRWSHDKIIEEVNYHSSRWISYVASTGDEVLATALLDRLLHHAEVISITGRSYRMKERQVDRMGEAASPEVARRATGTLSTGGGQVGVGVS
jgi:hypothetical protein